MATNFYDSPDVRNYVIPTGIAYFRTEDVTDYADLGACSAQTISISTTKKDHKIARGGTVSTDFSVITDVSATLKLTLDELTPENFALFLLSDVTLNTDGSKSVETLASPNKSGYFKFVADQAYGPQYSWEAYVTLGPSGDLSGIDLNADFATLPIEGSINKDPVTGKFPTFNFPATK